MTIPKPPNLDLFGNPDTENQKPAHKSGSLKKSKSSSIPKKSKIEDTESTIQASQASKSRAKNPDINIHQGFLPGLSRRGRPRSKNPISAVERTAKHRRERLESGSKRVEVILSPEVTQKLQTLADQLKEPKSEVISALITKAYSRLSKAK
ncbi:hypothetical protein G3I67_00185 [Orrella sp. NBD-18]|uniref:Uncharacterized protein n=1 Tax=Sheuella amnicola TaxID=2707330 RepID=A0A6B2QVG7_9BURK|nr:hypothetical protein [Sheuella amnicola]NDY81638.1 hypothetical protein [Sheuella amnicola]